MIYLFLSVHRNSVVSDCLVQKFSHEGRERHAETTEAGLEAFKAESNCYWEFTSV